MEVVAPAAAAVPQQAAATPAEAEVPATVPEALKATMVARAGELSKARRKRDATAGLADTDAVRAYAVAASLPLHGAGEPGVLCLDVRGAVAVTGGVDGSVCLVDLKQPQPHVVAQAESAHPRRVLRIALHPTVEGLAVSASADGTARVWSHDATAEAAAAAAATLKQVAELKIHDAAVTGLTCHAATGGDVVATASQDRSWALWDIRDGGKLLARVRDNRKADTPFTCATFHPDGLILATGGADNVIRMWDLKEQASVVALFEGHSLPITEIAFSENGFVTPSFFSPSFFLSLSVCTLCCSLHFLCSLPPSP